MLVVQIFSFRILYKNIISSLVFTNLPLTNIQKGILGNPLTCSPSPSSPYPSSSEPAQAQRKPGRDKTGVKVGPVEKTTTGVRVEPAVRIPAAGPDAATTGSKTSFFYDGPSRPATSGTAAARTPRASGTRPVIPRGGLAGQPLPPLLGLVRDLAKVRGSGGGETGRIATAPGSAATPSSRRAKRSCARASGGWMMSAGMGWRCRGKGSGERGEREGPGLIPRGCGGERRLSGGGAAG
jgi:hypothetical protein